MNRKIYQSLKKTLHDGIPADNEEHKEQVKRFVSESICLNKRKERIGYGTFILRQLRYAWRGLWPVQAAVLIGAWCMFKWFMHGDIGYMTSRHLPVILGSISIVLVMSFIPFLQRSYHYKMYEIEMASLRSLPGMFGANLILTGLGDVTVIAVCVVLTSSEYTLPAGNALLYMVLPFLVSSGGCIRIFRKMKEELKTWVCEVYCMLLIAGMLLLYRGMPQVFGYMNWWLAGSIIVLSAAGINFFRWMKEMEYEAGYM